MPKGKFTTVNLSLVLACIDVLLGTSKFKKNTLLS